MNTNIKDVFKTTNNYIVLATPLILYSLFSNVYAAISANGKLISIIFAIILLTLMSAAFIAGWFKMVKEAINDSYSENPNLLIKDFLSGVGEYFLPSAGVVIIISLFSILALIGAFLVGHNLIGDIGITVEQLNNAMSSSEELKLFISSLSDVQYIRISQWNLLILSTMALVYFLLIFYLPALFYKNKNPFLALVIGIKDLFTRKIFFIFFLTLSALFFYLFLSMLSAITMHNLILHFIVTLLNFYFIIWISVYIFSFYNNNFVKSHLGQNVDTFV